MKTAVINFKVDPQVKAQAQARAKQLGVPLSFILIRQLNAFAAGGKVEIPAEPMTPQMEKIIEQAMREIETGETSGPFTPDEFITNLKEMTNGQSKNPRSKADKRLH